MFRLPKLIGSLAALASGAVALAAEPQNTQPAAAHAENPAMVYVTMSTSMGDIKLELDPEKAPVSTANFLSYVDKKFYDGTIFHRVIGTFMIQGGGFTADMQQKPTDPPIKNEWQNGLKNNRGTIAMARTQAPDSATAQFFINVVDNPNLDRPISGGAGYAVFGKVVDGMSVVDQIKAVPTGVKNNMSDVPNDTVLIKSVVQTSGPKFSEIKARVEMLAAEAARAAAEANKKQFEEGLAFVKSRGGDVEKGTKTASGLWYTELKAGEGAGPSPTSRVKVHYTGWLTNGNKVDSSVDRGEPAVFGLNQVIKGWTEGVGLMKPGSKRLLVIPPELAYGASGRPPTIPQNATLVFEVELLEVMQ